MAYLDIKGNSPLDEAKRTEALRYLQVNATTSELEKIVKLAKDPGKRAMLKIL